MLNVVAARILPWGCIGQGICLKTSIGRKWERNGKTNLYVQSVHQAAIQMAHLPDGASGITISQKRNTSSRTMANLKKARVYADELAEKSGLVSECDRAIFANGFVEGMKVALNNVNAVAMRGNIREVIKYCEVEE